MVDFTLLRAIRLIGTLWALASNASATKAEAAAALGRLQAIVKKYKLEAHLTKEMTMAIRTGPRRGRDDDSRDSRRDRDTRDDRRSDKQSRSRDDDRGRRDERDDDRGRSSTRGQRRPSFKYTPPSADRVKKQAERKGGRFDSAFKDGVDTWRPHVGLNNLRILPPTWDGHDYFGYQIFVHQYIGPNGDTYLCPREMYEKPCCICDQAGEAKRSGDKEEAKELRVRDAWVYYVLDRDGDDPLQPIPWQASWTMDQQVAALVRDEKTGKVLPVDNPHEGHDLTFRRAGTTKENTKYTGMKFDHDPSPISSRDKDVDKILKYIEDNPIPSLLKVYPNDYLEKVISGTNEERDTDLDDDDKDAERDDTDYDDRDREAESDNEAAEAAADNPSDDDDGDAYGDDPADDDASADDEQDDGAEEEAADEGGEERDAEEDDRATRRKPRDDRQERGASRERVRPTEAKNGRRGRDDDKRDSRRDRDTRDDKPRQSRPQPRNGRNVGSGRRTLRD